MIYRILVDDRYHTTDGAGRRQAMRWRAQYDDRGLIGCGYGMLADVMDEHNLFAPDLTNSRARFFFTELGWNRVGRHVAGEARRLGHVVRVRRDKEPCQSRVVFRDRYQLALLPVRGRL